MNSPYLINSLSRQNSAYTPFWFMRQAGRYLPEYREIRSNFPSFLEFCYSPKQAAEVTIQPIRRFDMDAAILFSDILVIPDALGMKVKFVKGEGPQLEALENPASLSGLSLDRVISHLSPVFETVSLVREKLQQEKTLIGFCGSPWTVACYMIEGSGSKEFAKVRQFFYRYPEAFNTIMEMLVDASVLYLSGQVKAGAQCLQLFDSWAGLLPSDKFDAYVIAPTKKIVARLKAEYPQLPIIGFAKGAGANLLRYAQQTGVDGLGLDTSVPLEWAKKELSDAKVLQGNLDPILLASDKEGAIKETNRILEMMENVPFIFNLGHGIIPETPIENVEAVVKTIKRFNETRHV